MKRLLGLLLAVGMVFTLVGCSFRSGDSSSSLENSSTSEDAGTSAPVIDGDNELPLIPIG